jgi:hypothetical protein
MKYLLLAAGAVVVSTAGSSVSHGTRILLANNISQADDGNCGTAFRNRETALQPDIDRYDPPIAALCVAGGNLRDRTTA